MSFLKSYVPSNIQEIPAVYETQIFNPMLRTFASGSYHEADNLDSSISLALSLTHT
jgi:hypothetical protein